MLTTAVKMYALLRRTDPLPAPAPSSLETALQILIAQSRMSR